MGKDVTQAPEPVTWEGPTPFRETHVIRWGDCDPAGIIYTPRVLDHAMEALESWYLAVPQVDWFRLNHELGLGAPTVRTEIDFLKVLRPDDRLTVEVHVTRLGNASLEFLIPGVGEADGETYFRVRLTACFIKRPEMRATRVPEPYRSRIAAYRDACQQVSPHPA